MFSMNDFNGPSKRYALHTQADYETALAGVLNSYGVSLAPSVTSLDRLAEIAVVFASSVEGSSRVLRDIAAADGKQLWELSALLSTAHSKGRERAQVFSETAKITQPVAPAAKPVLGQRALKDWRPDQPIWPKKEKVVDILSHTDIDLADEVLGMKAFRSLFVKAWKSCFYPSGSAVPVPPYSDDEGWGWRKYATETAERQLVGSSSMKVRDLVSGMVVYNGFGLRTISALKATGIQRLAREGGVLKDVKIFEITYTDGNVDSKVAEDMVFVRIPVLEKGKPSISEGLPGLDFS